MKKTYILAFLSIICFGCNEAVYEINQDTTKIYLPTILMGDDLVITLTFDNKSQIVQVGEVAENGEYARLYTFYYNQEILTSVDAIYFSTVEEGGYNYSEKFKFEYINDRVMIEKEFHDNHGYKTTTNEIIRIDDKNNLIEANGLNLNYDQKGNLIEINENGNLTKVKYDDKNGSFLNVKTPSWALFYIMKLGHFYRYNNPVKITTYRADKEIEENSIVIIEREFEYNVNNYPIKYFETKINENGIISEQQYKIEYFWLYTE